MTAIAALRAELGVLQAVAKANVFPAYYECKTHKAAVGWRARTYKANAELRRIDARKRGVPEEEGISPFDHIKLVIEDNRVVYLERLIEGVLVIGGDAVDVAPYMPEGVSDLELDTDFSDFEKFLEDNK